MVLFYFILFSMAFMLLSNDHLRLSFVFSINDEVKKFKKSISLKDIKFSRILSVAPVVAAIGKGAGGAAASGGGGAAAAGGGGGMMGKMGGMMGGKGGGGGGGGMMQGIVAIGQKGTDLAKRTTQAGVSGITALVQGIKAKKLKDKADAAMPELVDPGQAAFLSELQAKRRSIDTGADFAAGMQAIDSTNAGTNDALVRSAGGDAGGTIQALLQSERVAGDSKNNVLAQGQQQQMQYNSMYGNLLNDMSQRRLELQLMQSQQARAEWAKMQSNAAKNFQGFLGGGPMMGKKGDMSQAAPLPQMGEAPTQGTIPFTPTNAGGATDNGWKNIASKIPASATPTPQSAGIPNAPVTMGGKAEMPPMVSGVDMSSMGTILKK